MKRLKGNLTLKHRIYGSFSLLVCLFVLNCIITIVSINKIKNLSNRLTKVVEPSLQSLDDFKKLMVESKMYTTNWVFLRANQEDKELLNKLHNADYPKLKPRIDYCATNWRDRNWVDTLNNIYKGFEELLAIEKEIMLSLHTFDDYNDPVLKLEAEQKIEEEILPRTTSLINSLDRMIVFGTGVRASENGRLEQVSMNLRFFILLLAILIVCAGFFLSRYMTRAIIGPVKRIRSIVTDLSRGITRTIEGAPRKDEIGEMVRSVNHLSERLSVTAAFAHEIGNRNFSTWYEPLSKDDTLGNALITMRDNLRQSEKNLALNTQELERKNKELEQFVYIASHDLQEPLRTTASFVELLQQQYHGQIDGIADKYLTYIVQSTDRMKILINDLLDYSRIGNRKKLQAVDCNIVLGEVVDDLNKTIRDEKAEIHIESLPVIRGYKTEIKQLFQNLVVNAIKFRKKDVKPQIHISARLNKDHWTFSVSDNGIGIAEDHKDRIFVIFQRLHTRAEYEGSGIGLAHCKKIVGLHGGKIWTESIPGNGATFLFNIPQIKTL
jgi:signal transduction histidine kinase